MGSSGVGKSTLMNGLLGKEILATGGLRNDDRGRHTTTRRQMFFLPGGAALIDTPGMRELGLWDSESGLETAFADIEALARQCRFQDCVTKRNPAVLFGRRWRRANYRRNVFGHGSGFLLKTVMPMTGRLI